MDQWLAASNFNDPTLKGTSYSKVGIACACDQGSHVRCVFLFGAVVIGNQITDKLPQFMPYTPIASCPALSGSPTLFSSSTCTATQYSNGNCFECSSRIDNCNACTFSESATLQVVCSGC